MTQTARVTRIEGSLARITYREPEGDKARSSRRFWGVREAEFQALIPEGLELKPDDYVEILITPGKSVLSAFWVLLLPLLFFPLVYLLAEKLFPGRFSDPLKGLMGLVGVALGFALNFLAATINKKRGREWLPVITRIISRESMAKEDPKRHCNGCNLCS